jgi:hypothetical protein
MNDEECLAHYRLLIHPDLYFRLVKEYEEKHGVHVVEDAKALVRELKK